MSDANKSNSSTPKQVILEKGGVKPSAATGGREPPTGGSGVPQSAGEAPAKPAAQPAASSDEKS